MVASLNLNPMQTTNAAGSFAIQSEGYIQGFAMDDPALRNELCGGILAATETLPMWGGVGITESIAIPASATTFNPNLGNSITRATSITGSTALTGFSCYDQAHAMLTTPQSQAPVALNGMSVNFYRLGSGIYLPVACDPALAALLTGGSSGIINQQVSWDFVNQQLVEFEAAQAAITITGATWASGVATYTASATEVLTTGDEVTITGISPAGYNVSGDVTVTSGTTFTIPIAVNPGSYVSGGSIPASGGALNVRVIHAITNNCKIVTYNAANGFANWNNNGACALLLL
jgi:hypothetical protein